MVNYIIIHNKHEGCYDYKYYEDDEAKIRLTSITINPPKIFLFNNKEQAHDFFEEYINDVDMVDNRCKKGDEVEHLTYCTCGIIEVDDDDNPILFYNKKNQIFLLEDGPKVFQPSQDIKNDVKNLNLTNKLIRKCKTLSSEQRKRYIELGKYCEECINDEGDEIEGAAFKFGNHDTAVNAENIVLSNTNKVDVEVQEPIKPVDKEEIVEPPRKVEKQPATKKKSRTNKA